MSYWMVKASDRDEYLKGASTAARLLYYEAGAWAMEQVYNKREPLPDDWWIPKALVRKWGQRRAAEQLVELGIWEVQRRGRQEGYAYRRIDWHNTPVAIAVKREEDREKKREQRAVRG